MLTLKRIICPILILLSILLVHPLFWLRLFLPVIHVHFFTAFSAGLISMLCLSFCLLNCDKLIKTLHSAKYILLTLLLFVFVAVVHFDYYSGYDAESFFQTLSLVLIPFTVYLYAEDFKRILPYFMSLLWLMVISHTIRDYIAGETLPHGIPGNINWNAALGLITSIYTSVNLYQLLKKRISISKATVCIIVTVPIAFGVILAVSCMSRGTILAFIAATAVFTFFGLKLNHKKIVLTAGILAGVFAVAFVLIYSNYFYSKLIANDVRLPIWDGAIRLIADNWIFGTSPAGFESHFAEYLKEEYYMKTFAAMRNNHPHNHFLYIFATMGIFVGAIWFIMTVYPVVLFFVNYNKKPDAYLKTAVFCYMILLFYGMLDLVLYSWPTSFIFLILLGLIWAETWEPDRGDNEIKLYPAVKYACVVVALGCIAFAIYRVIINVKSSYHFRLGTISYARKDYDYAAEQFDKAVAGKKDPAYINRAACNWFYILLNNDMTTQDLNKYDPQLNRNYSHNNGIKGKILLHQRKPREALKYFEQEVRNFPLGVIGHFCLYLAQSELGMKVESVKSLQKTKYCLEKKGMNFKHIPFLLKNPYYDDRWHEGKARLNEKTGTKQ